MKIKYIKAKNFLAITDGPFEIDFSKYGNIIHIIGKNKDYGDEHSNGSGKSSTIDCLVYALYGKLLKGLNHKEAINNRVKKGLEVEIHFDDYKIIRKRKPDELRLWKGDEEITLGGMPATQELINNIIGLHYDSFANVVCFGQHNEKSFLRCDAGDKRSIAENLLSLDKYIKFNKIAKDKRSETQDKIKQESFLYQAILTELQSANKRIEKLVNQQKQWRTIKEQELQNLTLVLEIKRKAYLSVPGASDYQDAKEEISRLESEIRSLDDNRKRIHAGVEKLEMTLQAKRDEKYEISLAASNVAREIKTIEGDMSIIKLNNEELESGVGARCPVCNGEIGKDNISVLIDRNLSILSINEEKISGLKTRYEELEIQAKECDKKLKSILDTRQQANGKSMEIHSKLEEKNSRILDLSKRQAPAQTTLETEIDQLAWKIGMKSKEEDPYAPLITVINQELKEVIEKAEKHKDQIGELEKIIPYYEFWVRAFGDDGIRAFVLDEIIPSLNKNINYWLQFLMDNKIRLNFNNQLEEKIERFNGDKNPYVYSMLSGGEHQRIDLAISLAFAHVMMLTSGSCPSLIALDEVGTNLDRPGIYAIYNTICELSRDRQVLVTTHHPALQELLAQHDTLEVIMEGGITRLKQEI